MNKKIHSADPRDLDGTNLQQAMELLSKDRPTKIKIIDLLKEFEKTYQYSGSIRDDITGPIVDSLHAESDTYQICLKDGTMFSFLYRTKIARDFLMSSSESSDHVWEPQTTRLLIALAAKTQGDVIIGGAYFGDHAILIAKEIIEQKRKVHCFEMNVDQVKMLDINIKQNDLDNVTVNQIGLWSNSNSSLILNGFDSFATAIPGEGDNAIKTISIDDYCDKLGLKISLIQLDIEGAELQAISGSRRIIENQKPSLVFEIHRSYVDWDEGLEKTDVCMFLQQFGYYIFAIRDCNSHSNMQLNSIEIIPLDKVYLDGPPHGFNMLAIPDINLLKQLNVRIVENLSPKLLPHKQSYLFHPADG